MKKIKESILHLLSGVEMLIRGFSNRETTGTPIDLTIPATPRVMSTCCPEEPRDFNAWAQHVHREIQAQYK